MAACDAREAALFRSVIGSFYEVYNTLGVGFLEHLHLMALERELRARGHHVGREVAVHVAYKGEPLGQQRLDMIVDERLIVEVKSTERLHPVARRQLMGYLLATRLELGLLLHFGPEPRFERLVVRHRALGEIGSPVHDGEKTAE